MTIIENKKFGGNFHQKVLKMKMISLTLFWILSKLDYFKNNSFFRLQNLIINNFYGSYESLKFILEKKA